MKVKYIFFCMLSGFILLSGLPTPSTFAHPGKENNLSTLNDSDPLATIRQLELLPPELQIQISQYLVPPVESFMSHRMMKYFIPSETLNLKSKIHSTTFSPDGSKVASALHNSTIHVQDLVTHESTILQGHQGAVASISFSTDGSILASGSADHTVRLWDIHSGSLITTWEGHTDIVDYVAYNPDGSTVASSSRDQTMRIWDLNTGEARVFPYQGGPAPVVFSPDGSKVVLGSDKGAIIQRTKTGEMLKELDQTYVTSIAFSPSGKKFATALSKNDPKEIHLWNAKTWELISTLTGHTKQINSIAFSPDEKYLACGSCDSTISIWSVDQSKKIRTLKGHIDQVWDVDFSPDGSKLASCSYDGKVKIWRLYDKAALENLFTKYCSPPVVLLLYVLHQNWNKGVNLTKTEESIKDAYKKKYPKEKLPSLLEFRKTYDELPLELKKWIDLCFHVSQKDTSAPTKRKEIDVNQEDHTTLPLTKRRKLDTSQQDRSSVGKRKQSDDGEEDILAPSPSKRRKLNTGQEDPSAPRPSEHEK